MDLKSILQEYHSTGDLNIANIDRLLTEMIEDIGHPDPELRDTLIYSTLARWVNSDILSIEQERKLLMKVLDEEHLFYEIGKRFTDSVFTRSFSSLAAALILEKDSNGLQLPETLIQSAIDKSINYLKEERDTRGFVSGKGWAHSIAHGADLLTAAINHPSFDRALIPSCLEVIALCFEKEAVYMDDEDERLIFAIEALLKKGLEVHILDEWIISLNAELKASNQSTGYTLPFFRRKKNISDFLKSLYFRLEYLQNHKETQKTIKKVLGHWHQVVYNPS
ncbi:DUF2785 domain-containing protein [Bacillus sp. AK031]